MVQYMTNLTPSLLIINAFSSKNETTIQIIKQQYVVTYDVQQSAILPIHMTSHLPFRYKLFIIHISTRFNVLQPVGLSEPNRYKMGA